MQTIPKVKVTAYYRKPYTIRLAPTRWQLLKFRMRQFIRFMTYSLMGLAAFALSASFIAAGLATSTTTTFAQEVPVAAALKAPVMTRIAKCESGNSQVGRDGQITIHVNTNGTYDLGVYQINSIHNAEATKMGYNLYVEKDNRAYAEYLYTNRGTGDWASSQSCWGK